MNPTSNWFLTTDDCKTSHNERQSMASRSHEKISSWLGLEER